MSLEVAAAHGAIKTAAQSQQLKNERPTHSRELEHTIGGTIETAVHRQVDQEREQRIKTTDSRLAQMRAKTDNDFTFSAHHGRARAHFEHER